MWLLFPGPLPEDAELTDGPPLALDIEKIQVPQEQRGCFVLAQCFRQARCHTWFPASDAVTVLYKAVASLVLQGSKGSKTQV